MAFSGDDPWTPAQTMSWGLGMRGIPKAVLYLFPQTHAPERGLETAGRREAAGEIGPAGRDLGIGTDPPSGDGFEQNAGGVADLLVVASGIGVDPGAVGRVRIRGRLQPRADFAIAEDTGGDGDDQIEQVARESSVDQEAGIGERFGGLLGCGELGLAETFGSAGFDMEAHFLVDQGMNGGRGVAHFVDAVGLDDGQSPGAGEVDEEEVVLAEVAQKGFARQAAIAKALDKRVLGIIEPGMPAGCFQRPEQRRAIVGHRSLPTAAKA